MARDTPLPPLKGRTTALPRATPPHRRLRQKSPCPTPPAVPQTPLRQPPATLKNLRHQLLRYLPTLQHHPSAAAKTLQRQPQPRLLPARVTQQPPSAHKNHGPRQTGRNLLQAPAHRARCPTACPLRLSATAPCLQPRQRHRAHNYAPAGRVPRKNSLTILCFFPSIRYRSSRRGKKVIFASCFWAKQSYFLEIMRKKGNFSLLCAPRNKRHRGRPKPPFTARVTTRFPCLCSAFLSLKRVCKRGVPCGNPGLRMASCSAFS